MPASIVIFGVLLGLPLTLSSLADVSSIFGIIRLIGGLAVLGFAAQIAFAKLGRVDKFR